MSLLKKDTTEKMIDEKDAVTSSDAAPVQKKGVKIVKTILNVIINILIVFVLIVSVLIATMTITSKANNGISTVFGRTVQTIQSDSMKGGSPDGYTDCDIQQGDLVFGWPTGNDDYAEYEIGDVVTFVERDTDGSSMLIAHRIVDKVKGSDGYYRYQTWGDNREVSQAPDQRTVDEYLAAYDISTVICDKNHKTTVLHGVGGFLDFIRTSKGFFFVVLVPMIIFFLYAILRVVINAMNYKKAKAEESAEDAERNKQAEIDAAVKAALAAAGVKNDADNASDSPEK